MTRRFMLLSVAIFAPLCLLSSGNPCSAGQTFQCQDGSTPGSSPPPCPSGKPQCCTGASCSDAPPPSGGAGSGGSGGGAPSGGAPSGGGGGGGGGTKACANPSCATPPCAASKLGDVGCTTVAGIETISHEMKAKGATIASDSHIYGAFEAGFGTQQKSIIEGWGCTDASVAYDSAGGLDISIAEKKVAHLCNVQLPRIEGDKYIGIVGACGGHTSDYHFHRSLQCLYTHSGGHSPALGIVGPWKLYGMWEDHANNKLPLLDACGAHFGPTPDSAGANVYHYHVQDRAPFTVGCVGPTADNKLVSVAACRALDSNCDGVLSDIHTGANTVVKYDRFCPCFDATGSNSGINIVELPALANGAAISCTKSATCGDYSQMPSGNAQPAVVSSTSATSGTSSTAGGTAGATSQSAAQVSLSRFMSFGTPVWTLFVMLLWTMS